MNTAVAAGMTALRTNRPSPAVAQTAGYGLGVLRMVQRRASLSDDRGRYLDAADDLDRRNPHMTFRAEVSAGPFCTYDKFLKSSGMGAGGGVRDRQPLENH